MVKTFGDRITDNLILPTYKYCMIVLGPVMVVSLYALVGVQVYAIFGFIAGLLKKRLGTWQALIWIAIGLIILYNILFNHLLATIVKANSPKDLCVIENLRQ